MKPLISFVVIEYFSIKEINDCISSITESVKNVPYEIIVSSNSQYPQEEREGLFTDEHVSWVFNERNGGFAYGMNQGLKKAKGKYRIIMNPDVKILNGLDNMIEFMDNNPEVGAIAPKIISSNGEIQDSCRPYVSLPRFIGRTLRHLITRQSSLLTKSFDYNIVQTVDWVIGAFILVRDTILEKTQGLDEHYFMYAEDLDWCTRIRQLNYEIVYFPKALIEYKGSRVMRKSLKYAKIFLKSHIYYWRKFGFISGYPERRKLKWS